MAEEDSGQEKTEEPTARRLEKAREEGQVPRSKELNTLAVLIAGSLSLMIFGPLYLQAGETIAALGFDFADLAKASPDAVMARLGEAGMTALLAMVPYFFIMILAAIIGPISLGGWLMSASAMAPKFSRMDPLKGLGRIFSRNSLMEFLKAVAKVVLVASVAMLTLSLLTGEIQMLGRYVGEVAIPTAALIIVGAFLAMSLSLVLVALIDVPFQIVEHTRKLKMTRQEVKDELKNTEGKPEVKSRVRQLQQEMARQRMMSNVPDADVVITNPTHFAVALKYDPETMSSPKLVAKGVDTVASMIRQVGTESGVPLVSYPILARALYHTTRLEEQIPEGLYVAVAQVLAWVFQLKRYRDGAGAAPRPLGELDIPQDFRDIAMRE